MATPDFTKQTDRTFRFGPFELSEREGELRKSGVRIKLQEQTFRARWSNRRANDVMDR